MAVVILNGSPRKQGRTVQLLRAVAAGAALRHDVEQIDVYQLTIKPCRGCMRCRPDKECILPEDDAHLVGRKIGQAEGLVVGTPTYWGNMSGPLKMLFDRLVPVFEYIERDSLPKPRRKGMRGVLITVSGSPWPFNHLPWQGRGALTCLRIILRSGGARIAGTINLPGGKGSDEIPERVVRKARRLGASL